MRTNREVDSKVEKELGVFMDRYLYSRLKDNNGKQIEFIRHNDYKTQMSGVDVTLKAGKQEWLIDEKATIYYSNMMIPTFAFEMDSIQKSEGEPILGWFLNNDMKAEYYMLIWPNIKCQKGEDGILVQKDLNQVTSNDFTIIEAMLIRKDDIFTYLKSKDWDTERMLSYSAEIRKAEKRGKVPVEGEDEFYYFSSPQIAERPVNLVIKKHILASMAKGRYFVSKDGYGLVK